MKYDYLIVGSAFWFHFCLRRKPREIRNVWSLIDKRSHIGGNIYTKEVEGIQLT